MRTTVVAVVLILMLATTAQAGEIFQYVDRWGAMSFTDDVKRIPAAYKDVAEKLVLEGEFEDILTVVTVNVPEYPRDFPRTPEITIPAAEVPNTIETFAELFADCGDSVTVTRERRQFGDFNRTVYLVHDECGNLVSETFSQPEVRINR